jgi:cytochrome b
VSADQADSLLTGINSILTGVAAQVGRPHRTEPLDMPSETMKTSAMVRVWSPLIRIGHWTLVAAFAIAYLAEDDLLTVHTWAGYAAAGAVAVRLAWGLVGPEQDRLSHFLRPPAEVLTYLGDVLRGRSRRYLGHSPAGAVMGLTLLLCMAATAGTGMVTLAQSRNAGPLAPWFGSGAAQLTLSPISPAFADGNREKGEDRSRGTDARSPMKDAHEFLANLTLALTLLHVTGVVVASLSHRENLARSMITGDKPADLT